MESALNYEKDRTMVNPLDESSPDPQKPVAPVGYSLRPATEDDIPRIVEIEGKVHQAPWTAGHFQAELSKPFSQFWVLTDDETDERIAGYIVFWLMGEQAEILNVAVDLEHRGQGFAKYMVRKAASMALKEGAHRLVLDVRKSNQAAIGLYQHVGFTITQVRKGFYTSNGEDAYGMSLPLDERFDEAAGIEF